MKTSQKKPYQTDISSTQLVTQLRLQNQKLKQAILYYKSKYIQQKKQNQINKEKLKNIQNERFQIQRQHQEVPKIVGATQLMNISKLCENKDESEDYKNMSMTINIVKMDDMDKSCFQSKNLDNQKVKAINMSKNDLINGFKSDLILQYIKKRKFSTNSTQFNCQNNNLSYKFNHSQNLTENKQTQRKFMTLKQVNGQDNINQLNLISKVQKSKSSKMEEKRKSYFQKKKQN